MSKVIQKLENGEDVNILFFGDSISCGWSSSGLNAVNGIFDASNKAGNPDAEVLFWSQNFPNLKCINWTAEKFLDYEAQLEDIANSNKGVALTKNTSAYAEIIKSKEAVDYLNTNVNHGNDFTARMYAQEVMTALTPRNPEEDDFLPGDIDNDGKVDLKDVVTLAQAKAG